MGMEVKDESVYANPELGVAGRFAELITPAAESTNPELMVAGRSAKSIAPAAQSTNPELMVAGSSPNQLCL